jgi:hypothetical protein
MVARLAVAEGALSSVQGRLRALESVLLDDEVSTTSLISTHVDLINFGYMHACIDGS